MTSYNTLPEKKVKSKAESNMWMSADAKVSLTEKNAVETLSYLLVCQVS